MIWLDKPKDEILTIPGTDISFMTGFDFRIERYAPERYAVINIAVTRDGVVGRLPDNTYVFLKQTPRDPIMRFATVEEMEELEHLPDDWLSHIVLDTASV